MKKLIIAVCLVVSVSPAIAATKCEPDGRGGVCCWDTTKEGPFRPLSCM